MRTEPTILAYSIPDLEQAGVCGKTKAYQLIAEGKLDARQCGGRTLILAESLRAYLESLPPAPIRRKIAEVAE